MRFGVKQRAVGMFHHLACLIGGVAQASVQAQVGTGEFVQVAAYGG